MKLDILIGILFCLLSVKRITAEDVAFRFGISVRTAYRYIDELSGVVPIYAVKGKGGGFSIVDDFRLPTSFLTEGEYGAVLQAIDAYGRELPLEELRTARDKLTSCSRYAHTFDVSSSSLIIDSGPWGSTVNYGNKLRVLSECVAKSAVLRIRYRDALGEGTEREIEPHTLVLKQGIWYIYAFCLMRGEFRLFKVGRIESMIITDRSFRRRNTDELKQVFFFPDTSEDFGEVELGIDPSAVVEVEDWLGVECVGGEGSVKTAKAFLPVNAGLASRILGFGGRVTVIRPASLAQTVLDMARSVISAQTETSSHTD